MILNKKLIKSIILSILLIIFCFILVIFDVHADSWTYADFYVPTSFTTKYYNDNTSQVSTTENFNMVQNITLYDEQFYTTDWNTATTNIPPQYYFRIFANIPTTSSSNYFSFIFYSPYDLDIMTPSIFIKDSGGGFTFLNYSMNLCTKTQTQTEGTNIFYVCSFESSDLYDVTNRIVMYGLDWGGYPSTTIFAQSDDYAISPLYTFATDTDRLNFNSSMINLFNNASTDDPNGNPNNFDNIYSDYINSNDWGSNIGGWGHSFDTSQSTITDLITMPITLIRAIINNASTTCSSYTLGSIYNVALVLPCISLSTYLGSTLTTTIDLLLAGLIIYHIGKKFVKIFDDFTNLRDNQINELYGGGK